MRGSFFKTPAFVQNYVFHKGTRKMKPELVLLGRVLRIKYWEDSAEVRKPLIFCRSAVISERVVESLVSNYCGGKSGQLMKRQRRLFLNRCWGASKEEISSREENGRYNRCQLFFTTFALRLTPKNVLIPFTIYERLNWDHTTAECFLAGYLRLLC